MTSLPLVLCLVAALPAVALAQSSLFATVYSTGDAVDRYLAARAAAEVCYGRILTEEESASFFKSLAYRDVKLRSAQRLTRETEATLAAYRQFVEGAGCDNIDVGTALNDWDLRVTLFTGIELSRPSDRQLIADIETETTGSVE